MCVPLGIGGERAKACFNVINLNLNNLNVVQLGAQVGNEDVRVSLLNQLAYR